MRRAADGDQNRSPAVAPAKNIRDDRPQHPERVGGEWVRRYTVTTADQSRLQLLLYERNVMDGVNQSILSALTRGTLTEDSGVAIRAFSAWHNTADKLKGK
jgi:hypothetical protein